MEKVIVASWTQSQGRPIARVMTSPSTRTLKPVMAIPHRIIRMFSRGSSARHFRWRCSVETRLSKRIDPFRDPKAGTNAESLAAPRVDGYAAYFVLRTKLRTFTAFGPKSEARLSLIGLLI